MKKILFLTSNNLATNPRLVKELFLAKELGYQFLVVQFNLNNWSDAKTLEIERQFNSEANFQFYNIDAIPKKRWKFLAYGLSERLAKILYPLIPENLLINAVGNSKRSIQIWLFLRNLKFDPNIIVAHNLPTLYPAYMFSVNVKVPFIFDVEDYHPGETIAKDTMNEVARRKFLMKKLLPKAGALLSASPMIALYVNKIVCSHKNHNVVLNGFPKNDFILSTFSNDEIDYTSKEISMVWFSQNISFGRGLEELISAILLFSKNKNTFVIKLTLIGEINLDFKKNFLDLTLEENYPEKVMVNLQPPMSQSELHLKLSDYDIGLAIELKDADLNRNLCITNKIIAYAQSGLYIFATNTEAQVQFLNVNRGLGITVNQNINGMYNGLIEICNDIENIRRNKLARYEKGTSLSWETEKSKISKIWREI